MAASLFESEKNDLSEIYMLKQDSSDIQFLDFESH